AISLLSMREFASLWPDQPMPRGRLLTVYGLIVGGYVALAIGSVHGFVTWIPLLAVALPSVMLVLRGKSKSFVSHVGRVAFGVLLTTFALGHVAMLVSLAPDPNPVADAAGLFLFVIVVTELNDIAQALVGRRVGSRKLTSISPNKTWEGFAGGVVAATVAAALLGHWLTPMTWYQSTLAGVLISIFGLLGDLNMSAIKRDAGVKDSGDLLPGQGGILDRVDSLTFTAPLFYYYFVGCCT
ncbi:MAG: phosphatidate cytidylyltransferase, partial [Pirellulaceae bacterium]|nr:phosphatidate cytidylyltransferase [Pirellulaceae bacterium]